MFVGVSSLFIPLTTSPTHITFHNLNIKLQLNNSNKSIQNISKSPSLLSCSSSNSSKICLLCGRRPFLATLSTALIKINKSNASDSLPDDPMVPNFHLHFQYVMYSCIVCIIIALRMIVLDSVTSI